MLGRDSICDTESHREAEVRASAMLNLITVMGPKTPFSVHSVIAEPPRSPIAAHPPLDIIGWHSLVKLVEE